MKKILFLFAAVVLSSVVMAEKPSIFVSNEVGEAKVVGEIRGNFDKATAFKAVQRWVNMGNFETDNVKFVDGESVTCEIDFETQSRWNPFAGDFLEYLFFDCSVKCADGVISYELTDLKILFIYAGYGLTQRHNSVAEYLETIKECQAIIDNPASSKSAVAKAKKEMKDPEGSLASAAEEIEKRVQKALEKSLKKVQ